MPQERQRYDAGAARTKSGDVRKQHSFHTRQNIATDDFHGTDLLSDDDSQNLDGENCTAHVHV